MIRNLFECFETLERTDQLHAIGNVGIAESDVVLELSDFILQINTVVVDVAV